MPHQPHSHLLDNTVHLTQKELREILHAIDELTVLRAKIAGHLASAESTIEQQLEAKTQELRILDLYVMYDEASY